MSELTEPDDRGDAEIVEDGSETHEEEPTEPAGESRSHVSLFEHPDAHPLALGLLLEKKYGKEWEELETETLEFLVSRDFRAATLSELSLHKIEALRTLRSTPCFWRRYEVFVWCAMPLNGVLPDFEVMQVPTYAQALVAGDIAKVVRPDEAWSAEMRAYLRVVAEHDGVYCAVEPFGFLEFEPRGVLDPRDVQRAWPAVLRAGEAPEGETIVAEQLRRALSAHEYVLEARRSLTAQLPLVDRVV